MRDGAALAYAQDQDGHGVVIIFAAQVLAGKNSGGGVFLSLPLFLSLLSYYEKMTAKYTGKQHRRRSPLHQI